MGKASEIWKEIKPKIGEMLMTVNDIETQAEKAQKEAYENGFIAGHLKAEKSGQSFYEDGYQRGLNDAWDTVRKIRGMTWNEQKEVFGTDYFTDIIALPASECIEKIRAYEQEKEKEIQVGDEVEAMAGNAVVIEVIDGGQTVRYMYPDTITGRNKVCNVTRTGRHFTEIAEVLQKMKE